MHSEGKWGSTGQLRQLRELDLEQIEKPKTLVILHYCGKRISVPLFQEVGNLAQLLYHHIAKLEQAVLSNQPAWEKNSNAQILCFQIKKDSAATSAPERQSDGDLRSDILLSLLRVEGKPEESPEELLFRVDVTKVYKYLQIQPFYRFFEVPQHPQAKLQPQFPYFSFHRQLSQTRLSSTFLARRTSNGHFYAVKVYATGAGVGLQQLRTVQHLQRTDQARRDANLRCSLLVRSHLCALVPHPEAEEGESDDESSCRHIALAVPFFVRGTLQDLLKEARYSRSKRLGQMQCLNYLKELMWGAHLLHQKYNIIHRAIIPSHLLIDQNGQLRLTSYFSCLPCYTPDAHATYISKINRNSSTAELQESFQEGEYDVGEYTAPQVLRGQPYNYLVDFYAIGVIIRKLYELSQAHERVPISQNNENLMMTMINRLTSPELSDRQAIVAEIIEDIERENDAPEPPLIASSLLLQDIKVGRPIEPRASKKFIENQESGNGIDLQVVSNYFRKPKTKEALLRPSLKKGTLKKIKDKSVKNSRERSEGRGQKSQKCLSKASAETHPRKISKKKTGSISKESPSQSRESKPTRKEDSPVKRPSKSKSHERKKKEEVSKVYIHQQQGKGKGAPVVPRSPKAQVIPRNKSPLLREKHK